MSLVRGQGVSDSLQTQTFKTINISHMTDTPIEYSCSSIQGLQLYATIHTSQLSTPLRQEQRATRRFLEATPASLVVVHGSTVART